MDTIRFKTLLLQRNLKHFEVSRRLGWSPSKLSSIVNGHWEPNRESAESICSVLKIPLHDLFPELDGRKVEKANRAKGRFSHSTNAI